MTREAKCGDNFGAQLKRRLLGSLVINLKRKKQASLCEGAAGGNLERKGRKGSLGPLLRDERE